MPLRPDFPRLAVAFLLAFSLPASAAGYLDSPAEEKPFRPFRYFEAGIDLYATPHVAVYYERFRSWQSGFDLRSWVVNAQSPYDLFPEAGMHIRKLWINNEDQESLAGSEYFDAALIVAPGYRFLTLDFVPSGEFLSEPRLGPVPGVRIAAGMNWKPFVDVPFGLDVNLAVGHYFVGHPPGFYHINFATAGISVFWVR